MRPELLRWGTSADYLTQVSFTRVFVRENETLQLSPDETVKKVDYSKERLEFAVIVMRTHVDTRSGP
jgi:O-glycosyl hydrolase